MKQLERLMFLQDGRCFFCDRTIPSGEASVEHLVATANGGGNGNDNCVACCKSLNGVFGSMSLKDKFRIVLSRRGEFKCPKTNGASYSSFSNETSQTRASQLDLVIADLRKRGSARPRRLTTLRNTIGALFHKRIPEDELSVLVEQLQAKGVVTITKTKVSYDLPLDGVSRSTVEGYVAF